MFNTDTTKMNNVQEESLREQKKGRRRALILEIARGLIASKGLRSLKVRDIAEAADCSIGSVYNEFGDFDGLILTVNRETVQALTARYKQAYGAIPATQYAYPAYPFLDLWGKAVTAAGSVALLTAVGRSSVREGSLAASGLCPWGSRACGKLPYATSRPMARIAISASEREATPLASMPTGSASARQ